MGRLIISREIFLRFFSPILRHPNMPCFFLNIIPVLGSHMQGHPNASIFIWVGHASPNEQVENAWWVRAPRYFTSTAQAVLKKNFDALFQRDNVINLYLELYSGLFCAIRGKQHFKDNLTK